MQVSLYSATKCFTGGRNVISESVCDFTAFRIGNLMGFPRRQFLVESPTFLPNTGLWGKLLFIWIFDEITGLFWPFLNMFSWLPVGKKNQKGDLFNISNISPRQKWGYFKVELRFLLETPCFSNLSPETKTSNTLTTVSFWSFKRDLNNITHCAPIFLSLKTLVVSYLSPVKLKKRSQQLYKMCMKSSTRKALNKGGKS